MAKQILLLFIAIFLIFIVGCAQNEDEARRIKNNCYDEKLKNLQNDPLYKEAMLQFIDTFKIMKNDKRYFGIPQVVYNKIDEAIFFDKHKTNCMLIVLQRNNYDFVFGSARMVRGKRQKGKWSFEVSMENTFDKDFYKLYHENSFENLSKLARYVVLTNGDAKENGCEIDEYFWFVYLDK